MTDPVRNPVEALPAELVKNTIRVLLIARSGTVTAPNIADQIAAEAVEGALRFTARAALASLEQAQPSICSAHQTPVQGCRLCYPAAQPEWVSVDGGLSRRLAAPHAAVPLAPTSGTVVVQVGAAAPQPDQAVAQKQHRSCPSHCCPEHGCKYGHDDCPVVSGLAAPVYPNNNGCEFCERSPQPPQAAELSDADRIVRMVLADHDICIGELGRDWQSQELSSETVEALNAYGDDLMMKRHNAAIAASKGKT